MGSGVEFDGEFRVEGVGSDEGDGLESSTLGDNFVRVDFGLDGHGGGEEVGEFFDQLGKSAGTSN